MESLRFDFETTKRRMEKELSRCVKLEDKGLKVIFGGYFKKEEALRVQYNKLM